MRASAGIVLVLLLAGPAPMRGQGAPISGTAQVTLSPSPASAGIGEVVQVLLRVNLTGVTGTAPGGGSTPAVLGGYQVSVAFDKTRLRFDSAAGGTSSGYTSNPTSTGPGGANASGMVTVVASQTSSSTPTGLITVAVLSFTTLGAGGAALNSIPTSLVSAFQFGVPSEGPTTIPGSGSEATITITGPAPTPTPTRTPVPATSTRTPTGTPAPPPAFTGTRTATPGKPPATATPASSRTPRATATRTKTPGHPPDGSPMRTRGLLSRRPPRAIQVPMRTPLPGGRVGGMAGSAWDLFSSPAGERVAYAGVLRTRSFRLNPDHQEFSDGSSL